MKNIFHLLLATTILVFSALYLRAKAEPIAATVNLWVKPADWPATPESARKPYMKFYETGQLPAHDGSNADDLGLKWEMPLRSSELGDMKMIDLGRVYCPTIAGQKSVNSGRRYRGIHRGHDLGVAATRLKNKKIPVHAIADGVYDGQRTYEHAAALENDCKPLVVYHFSTKNDKAIYTSIYCHLDPLPGLQAGQRIKKGAIIGYLEDPKGAWGAHVHLELYTQPVYASKDSTKFDRCGCSGIGDCDAIMKKTKKIMRGCGIFEDDLYIMEPVQFIRKYGG